MRLHTEDDIELDLSLLYRYETEDITQAALAESVGLSQSHLSRRLARARRHRERRREEEEGRRVRDREAAEDADDLPHLAITDDPSRERGHWYEPESGAASVDRGRVRIGNRNGTRLLVRSIGGGDHVRDPGGPTSHRPDPDGLRGGIG